MNRLYEFMTRCVARGGFIFAGVQIAHNGLSSPWVWCLLALGTCAMELLESRTWKAGA